MSAPNRPRVLHVITGLEQGGAETALFRLISSTADPGSHQVVSLTSRGIFGAKLEAKGAKVLALGMKSPISAVRGLIALIRVLRRERPRVVQTWMYHADLIGGVAAKIARIPICWGIRHSNLDSSANKRSTLAVARLCSILSKWVPSAIVSCSKRAIEIHLAYGYTDRFVHIPNGIDSSAYRPRDDSSDSASPLDGARASFRFGTVGRLHPQKDYPTLLRAFSLLDSADNASLALVGKGLSHENPEFARIQDASNPRVLALGPSDDVPTILRHLDVFVLSSVGEGFPNVVAEAMACGVPCIVTDVGDSAEIVGSTGWVVPPSSPKAMAEAMTNAINETDAGLAARRSEARQRIMGTFTTERMVEAYESIWKRVEFDAH